MKAFKRMYQGFMKDLGTHLNTLIIIGGTATYLFTHDPYVSNKIEASPIPEYIDPITLEISQLFSEIHQEISQSHSEIHQDFLGLEAKLDSIISSIE